MISKNQWTALVLCLGLQPLTGCLYRPPKANVPPPALVEAIDGEEYKKYDVKKVTFTESAMEKTGVEIGEVAKLQGPRNEEPQLAVPYGALFYDYKGYEWVYTNPEPRVFVRSKVSVDYIDGEVDTNMESWDRARKMVVYLKEGPEVGTAIVTVGASAMYGEETGYAVHRH
jgi:hypothetical protein